MKRLTVLVVTLLACLMATLPVVQAQTSASVTVTEAEINEVFWVTNPTNRHLSSVYVDLQAENEGQVTISAVYSWRTRAGVRSADVAVVLSPRISSGRLYWDVDAITANGEPASDEIVRQVNSYLSATWRRWIASNAPAGVLTGISITDDAITYHYTLR